mmetsp:Transcript_6299/g.13867  ORF Transcript_6299/g.13867 Transcript_6299/m.13867 type:complete len:411 (+) Transcript_6299:89-1321(+)
MIHHHDLRTQGQCVRLFPPVPPGPPDLNGRITSNKLIAIGHWNDDIDSHLFSFSNLQVTTRNDSVSSIKLDTLGTWGHDGAVTDIQVADQGSSGEVLMAVALSTGGLVLGRLLLPRNPGTSIEDVQILDLPADDNMLLPSAVPHTAAINSVDLHPETKAILTAGADGCLCVLDASDPSASPFKAASPGVYTSYTSARWADSQLFVTASSTGRLQMWDARAGPSPCLSAPAAWGAAGPRLRDPALPGALQQRISCLHVHPSRPNMCAAGTSGGAVAVWDLRFASAPASWAGEQELGGADVWEVRFDANEPLALPPATPSQQHPHQQQQQPVPPVLFVSDSGVLGRVSSPSTSTVQHSAAAPGYLGSGLEAKTLLSHPFAINSFDVEASAGRDVVCVTEDQQLIYVRRGAAL